MGFSLFSKYVPGMSRISGGGRGGSPIAINFGASSAKLLQIYESTPGAHAAGAKPILRAAAELVIPDGIRTDAEATLAYLGEHLPRVLRESGFRGRKVICTVPTQQTIIQHMQLPPVAAGAGGGLAGMASLSSWGGSKTSARDEMVKTQLQMQMGLSPSSVIVRAIDVSEATGLQREGQNSCEVICFAMPRDVIMRYVALLEKCKLEVAGVHTEALSMVRAFDHIHQRADDHKLTTMYIDLGWSGSCAAIAHGKQIVFARAISVGGRHFDERIAAHLKSDLAAARAHRLSLEDPLARLQMTAQSEPNRPPHNIEFERRTNAAPAALQHQILPGDAPHTAATVDLSELVDTTTDELSMSLRYHRGLFPNRPIDRVVLLGGEARQQWLCRHIATALRLPVRLGDPLARLVNAESLPACTPGVALDQPQPGWTVAWGLCAGHANVSA